VRGNGLPHDRLVRPYNNWPQPDLPEGSQVVFCVTEAEAQYCAQHYDLSRDLIIPLTPQAACECYIQSLPHRAIEEFFDVRAFLALDEPMLAFQAEWADELDAYVWEHVPEFKEYEFRPAGLYFYFLKVMLDTLFRASFGLAHVFLSNVTRAIWFEGREGATLQETLFFDEPVYGALIPAFARQYEVQAQVLPCPTGSGGQVPSPLLSPQPPAFSDGVAFKNPSLRGILKRFLPEWAVLFLKSKLFPEEHARLATQENEFRRPDILSFAWGGDLNFVLDLARERLIAVSEGSQAIGAFDSGHGLPCELGSRLQEFWATMKAETFFHRPLRWLGVDVGFAAESRLRHWWEMVVPAMWAALLGAHAYFECHRPRSLAFTSPHLPRDFGILQAARSLEIPTLGFQHGGFEGNCEYSTYDWTDLHHFDYRLVYGEGTASYFQSRIARLDQKRAELVVTGSPRLDSMGASGANSQHLRSKLGFAASDLIVLYVPTSYQYQWYMAKQSYLDVPYFHLLTRVVQVVKEFEKVRFLYKPFPDPYPDPILRVIDRDLPHGRVIADHEVLTLAGLADAVIIDLPSTALLEVLTTRKPILLFSDNRFVSLRPEARSLLIKRCIVTESEEDFFVQLRGFLGNDCFTEVDTLDRSFLRAYGTHLDDGCSAERAVQFLENLICH